MDEIPYGKYIDSNINNELPLSTEIVAYKAIKISNEMEENSRVFHTIDTSIQHAIQMNQRTISQREYIKCNCHPNIIKWIVISYFTISILFVFVSQFFSK